MPGRRPRKSPARLGALGRKDVRNALAGATSATLQDNGRWEITGGVDLEGIPVTLVVKVFGGLLVVTLF